ncbi:MAG: hypothetical protein GOMPHAMPRED_002263 [Gomphillus americanus]|uniref:Dynactin subunit 5 n=1 Tax=Gomphillus americanus TaxID=1940652 RepID=A0A8H3FEI6_9LECA|nr:MAG: hypothetical protein GOMPHAMPRED_002263 [Gomphillus americanus]
MAPKQAKGEYIETEAGNKVSRRSQIHGTTNIILGGRTVIQAEAVIRGDLLRTSTSTSSGAQQSVASLAVQTGKYAILSPGCVLHPPRKYHRGTLSHTTQKIGDNVYIGPGAIIEAATIGSNVWIGAGAVLGRLSFIRDGAKVLDGAVVPGGMIVNSGDIVGGRPARKVGETGWGDPWDGREAWRSI